MRIDTFDIEFNDYINEQPNVAFILNGSPAYGFRFRKLVSSFGSLIEWLNDYHQHLDMPPRKMWIKEEGISVFISCELIEADETKKQHLGHFSIGDDWDGEAFSFIAPIESVMRAVCQSMRTYYYSHRTWFGNRFMDVKWDNFDSR